MRVCNARRRRIFNYIRARFENRLRALGKAEMAVFLFALAAQIWGLLAPPRFRSTIKKRVCGSKYKKLALCVRILMAWIRTQSSKVTTDGPRCVRLSAICFRADCQDEKSNSWWPQRRCFHSATLHFQAAELRQKINKSNDFCFQLHEPDLKLHYTLALRSFM
jgi:hypothetical protein